MSTGTRRNFVGKITAMTAVVFGASKLFAQQVPATGAPKAGNGPTSSPGKDAPHRSGAESHTHDGIYYFSGTGSNDGYPKDDHVLVTDPFEKHVTRTMDALKVSRARGLHHGQHHSSPGFSVPASC
jgi:hypothetical protein